MNVTSQAAKELVDGATAAVSSAALTSPFWLPSLQGVSDTAALFTPILGGAWLIVQIAHKIREMRNK